MSSPDGGDVAAHRLPQRTRREHGLAKPLAILDDSNGLDQGVNAAQSVFSALESMGCFANREHLQDLKLAPKDVNGLFRILKQNVPESLMFIATVAAILMFPSMDYNGIFDDVETKSNDTTCALRSLVYRTMLKRPRANDTDEKVMVPSTLKVHQDEMARSIDHDLCRRWVEEGRISPLEALQFLRSKSQVLAADDNVAPGTFDKRMMKFRTDLRIIVASWRSVLSKIHLLSLRPYLAKWLSVLMFIVNTAIAIAKPDTIHRLCIGDMFIGTANLIVATYILYVFFSLHPRTVGLHRPMELIARSRFEAPPCVEVHLAEVMQRKLHKPPELQLPALLPMLMVCFFDPAGFVSDPSASGLMIIACFLCLFQISIQG